MLTQVSTQRMSGRVIDGAFSAPVATSDRRFFQGATSKPVGRSTQARPCIMRKQLCKMGFETECTKQSQSQALAASLPEDLHRPFCNEKDIRFLSVINPGLSFWGLEILFKAQGDLDTKKKIEKSRYPKEDISIPTTMCAGINTFRNPGDFLTYMYSY